MPTQVTDWGDALVTSFTAAMALFFSAIPKILAFLAILLIGWFVASLIEKGLATLLRTVRFNELARRSGFSEFVAKMGMDTDSAGLIALVVKWFVRLVAIAVAFDALGLPAVSEVLRQLLLWLPNVVVALVVLVIGGLAARALSSVVRGMASEAGLTNANTLAKVASVLIWSFAIVVAVNQIGIASNLVNALFMAIVGAMALATGLAFGLGGRDTAAEIVRTWYAKAQQKSAQLADEAQRREREDRAVENATGSPGGATWPTGGYPGATPADKRHPSEGG